MIHAQNTKKVMVIKPVSVATNATQTGRVDTLDFDYCSIDLILDSAAAVSSNPAVCKISEADVTNTSSFVTVSGFVGDTDWTIPDASTDTPQVVSFDIDCRPRKRYLQLAITSAGAAQLVAAVGTLSRAHEAPSTTTEAGVIARIQG